MANKFLEEIRQQMRMRGYSFKTEKALYWIKYFIRFHILRHRRDRVYVRRAYAHVLHLRSFFHLK